MEHYLKSCCKRYLFLSPTRLFPYVQPTNHQELGCIIWRPIRRSILVDCEEKILIIFSDVAFSKIVFKAYFLLLSYGRWLKQFSKNRPSGQIIFVCWNVCPCVSVCSPLRYRLNEIQNSLRKSNGTKWSQISKLTNKGCKLQRNIS